MLPPLLVQIHGGPTSAASTGLSLKKQYFTSRGFAILDIDYRGSTGYGKKYRDRLRTKYVYQKQDGFAGCGTSHDERVFQLGHLRC